MAGTRLDHLGDMIGPFSIREELSTFYELTGSFLSKDKLSLLKLLCLHTDVEVTSPALLIRGHSDSSSIPHLLDEIKIYPEIFEITSIVISFDLR